MLEEKTVLDTIEVSDGGMIRLRFAIMVLKDGVEISKKWHRTVVPPGGDVEAQIAAVNADITSRPDLMASPVDTGRTDELKAIAKLVHTPAKIKAFKEREEAEMKALTR